MLLCPREPLVSQHRLPQPYRLVLAALWSLPGLVVLIAAASKPGLLLDLRVLLPALVLLVPAAYIWREGVDVTPSAVIRRIHLPRRCPFHTLARWRFDHESGILRVWNRDGEIVLECRREQMTDFEGLVTRLSAQIRGCAADRSGG